jgi:hypothetical protein
MVRNVILMQMSRFFCPISRWWIIRKDVEEAATYTRYPTQPLECHITLPAVMLSLLYHTSYYLNKIAAYVDLYLGIYPRILIKVSFICIHRPTTCHNLESTVFQQLQFKICVSFQRIHSFRMLVLIHHLPYKCAHFCTWLCRALLLYAHFICAFDHRPFCFMRWISSKIFSADAFLGRVRPSGGLWVCGGLGQCSVRDPRALKNVAECGYVLHSL